MTGPASTLHGLFAAQAERTPNATALVYQDQRITYGELAERVRGLAAHLRSMGVGPEVPVGVCLERTPDLVATLLAVMTAGGCYVPLDPAYPRERLGFMLEDSGAPVVVTRADLAERLPEHGARLLCLPLNSDPGGEGPGAAGPGNLAYLIYTSGSTGRPKGVALEHRSAVAFARWARQVFSDAERRGVLAATSTAFDLSVFELFVTLAWGGTVILAANALELPDLPAAAEVTLINTVPSAMAELVRMEAVPPSVRTVNLAGEPLKNSLAQGIYAFPHVRRVLNLYGPSEDTTYSTWTEVEKGAAREPSIGRPVGGTDAWLVDESFALVPDGEAGEILLAGEGLARGYFRRPGLTAERFLPDPFSGLPGARLYRTGDLGRRRPEGDIDYLGRIDHQVKIRGFRIELGEIEVALEACAGVREAVVVAREDPSESRRLVAYVVAPPGEREGLVPALRARLGERLPAYMVPSAFVVLDRLPRTPNGKIDRKALPAPAAPTGNTGDIGDTGDTGDIGDIGDTGDPRVAFKAPRNSVEATLARLFAEVLGAGPVGIEDSFFDLGGDSLLAHRALARVRAALGSDLPQGTLFETPTVAALAERIAASEGRCPIPPIQPTAPIPAVDEPLSYAQERLWFHEHLAPGLPVYNIPAVLRLDGPLRPGVLERALAEIVRRHEPLRASFPEPEDGVPRQRIAPALGLPLPVVDLSGLPAEIRAAEAERRQFEEARRLFDLAEGPVARAVLVRRSAESHDLLLTLHHLVADGASLEVLHGELAALYPALARGLASPLPELPVRYSDFVVWQRRWLQGGELDAQLAWWRRALAGAPQSLALPTDRPRPPRPSFRGGRLRRELPPELERAARALAGRGKGTLFTVALAAFFALLHRWSGEDDLLVGVPVAGRHRAELEPLVGLFVNTVVLRCGTAGEPSFSGLLARVRESALGALAHQDLPFERLVAELRPERAAGRVPLAQVLFVMEREGRRPLAPGLSALLGEGDSGTAKVDLSLYLVETGGGLAAVLEHDADLYDRATAEGLLERYAALLAAAVAAPGTALSELPLLLPGEMEQLLREWNESPAPEPFIPVHRAFRERAARQPAATALVWAGGRMSYAELEERALRLAGRLRRRGIGPEAFVGLRLDRSADAIAGILGVLEAGGVCVPVDPADPAERAAFALEDSGCELLITRRDLDTGRPGPHVHRLFLEEDEAGPPPPPLAIDPDQAAFLMYTSGSTGRPKGVVLTHGGVSNLAQQQVRVCGLDASSRILQAAPVSFDAALSEIFITLLAGGELHLVSLEEVQAGPALARLLREHRITCATFGSTALRLLPETRFPDLAQLLVAGEPLTADLVAVWAPGRRLFDAYGPTETSVCATMGVVEAGQPISIGRPLAGLRAVVLDEALQPVTVGVAGELCIAGAGLARGYWRRPDLTAERFVPDPWSPQPGGRLYRTGDLARWLPGGRLDLLGRRDQQVKLNGYRVELGEVEAALAACPGVRQAAAGVRRVAGEPRLIAWIAGPGPVPAGAELRQRLALSLPTYMIPATFVALDSLPRTASGKIDRRALPDPEPARQEGTQEAPATELERELAAIWSEVLGFGPIGRNDDFFHLGGHSLLATRVFSRVRARWGVKLPVRALFEASTLGALARRIGEALRQAGPAVTLGPPVSVAPVPRSGDLPLSFAQQRFWFMERLAPGGATLNIPNPVRLAGPLEPAALMAALAGLVRRHETLRTTFGERAGTLVQVVQAPASPPLPLADLSALPAELRDREAGRLIDQEARRPFDLGRGPLLRAGLLRLDREEHRLLLTLHHIVGDGWSMEILVRELGLLYAAAVEQRPADLPPLPFQYADHAFWQSRRQTGEPRGLAWWRERLAGMEVLRLPADRPRPAARSQRGDCRHLTLPDGLDADLRALAQREGASLFMTILAAFLALLHRETGQTDLVVGTPVANRDRTDLEGLIGAFVNSLVLRVDLAGDPGFGALLGRVRETALAAYAHQDVPFERLVEELEPRRDPSRTPLFQALVSLQTAPAEPPRWAGATLEPVPVHTGTAQLDLTLYALDRGRRLELTCEYATDLFEGATIERLLERLQALLTVAVAEPERPLSQLPLPEATAPEPDRPAAAPASTGPVERLQESLEERRSKLSDEQRAMLARRLRGRKIAPVAPRALVPIDPAGTQPPFFCVHPAGGDVLCFQPLARHLGADVPFYGLQSPGIAAGIVADTEPSGSIEEMAASYVAEIRQVQPAGPWRIGGWSLGGVVAFEMAQQLARNGEEVELLAILDTVPRLADTQPAAGEPGFWEDDARWLLDIAAYAEGLWGKSLGLGYEELRSLGDAERLACCAERLAALQLLPPGAGVPYLARLLRVFKANVRAGLSYDPRPYAGRITLFRAADAPSGDPTLGWESYSPAPVEVHVCPGDHVTLLAEANAPALAERLRSCLDRRTVEIPA